MVYTLSIRIVKAAKDPERFDQSKSLCISLLWLPKQNTLDFVA